MQAPGKAGQAAGASYHPVAGNDDGKQIFVGGPAYGPGFVGIAESRCDLTIAPGLSKGDLLHAGPDCLLERCSLGPERQIKYFSFSLEILIQLGFGLAEQGGSMMSMSFDRGCSRGKILSCSIAWKINTDEGMIICNKRKLSQRARHLAAEEGGNCQVIMFFHGVVCVFNRRALLSPSLK